MGMCVQLPRTFSATSSRFELPLDLHGSLGRMTPVQYLSRHVAVSSARRQLYDKVGSPKRICSLYFLLVGEWCMFSLYSVVVKPPCMSASLAVRLLYCVVKMTIHKYTQLRPVSVEVGSGKLRSSVESTLPAPNLYANGMKLGVHISFLDMINM